MRKITREACAAFMARRKFKSGNTMTDGDGLYLHGNRIAYWTQGGYVIVRTAGWDSNTTRERLNGLPQVSVYRRKGELYLNGGKWDGNDVAIIGSGLNRGDTR